jgi:hypothetical protein
MSFSVKKTVQTGQKVFARLLVARTVDVRSNYVTYRLWLDRDDRTLYIETVPDPLPDERM